jgi:ABC-2 type transport system ATP-binding protein
MALPLTATVTVPKIAARLGGAAMTRIVVEELTRTFRIAERRAGTLGAFAGLLARRHREITALDRVSFEIPAGQIVGYIGPNGAGKSTTIKILSGILVPTSGSVRVGERVPWLDRAAHVARIGVVFGQRTQLWWDLPVVESFELLRRVYRCEAGPFQARLDELVEMLELAPLLDVPVRQLSLGQRMRCDLAAALLHAPDVLFLDEPTIGLDAVAKLAVRDFVRRLNAAHGTTVILTTHDMDDIEALADRILLVDGGRIAADSTLAELRRRFGSERRLIVDVEEGVALPEGLFEADDGLALLRREGLRLHVAFDARALPTTEAIARLSRRVPVHDLFVENPPIEELIARVYASARGGVP